MTDETARLRNTLSAQIVAVLAADFEREGADVVKRLREKDPTAYLRAVTAVTADTPPIESSWSDITDAELAATLAYVRKTLSAREDPVGGTRTPSERKQTGALSSIRKAEIVS